MRSVRTSAFIKQLSALPDHIQVQAREAFQQWKADPSRVGWHRLKGLSSPVYAAEVGLRWRALAVLDNPSQTWVWCFIGSHETYNGVIERYRQAPPRPKLR